MAPSVALREERGGFEVQCDKGGVRRSSNKVTRFNQADIEHRVCFPAPPVDDSFRGQQVC